jgi:SAM-dependent methyltransferase
MNFLELKDISERFMELINPTTPQKILEIAKIAGMKPGWQVIDFGCGFAEPLALWGEHLGVSGLGIDIRPYACQRARQKLAECGLSERIEIIEGSGSEYQFEPGRFDAAVCIGASFIWGGFAETLRAMRKAIRPAGKLIVGEPYWVSDTVPPEWAQNQPDVRTELQLLDLAHQQGFDFEYMIHSSLDDWDHYEASNWYGFLRWIEENPHHPERQQVIDELHASQEEYLRFGRKYFGWALFLLNPVKY